jgi:hypothetical protein
MADEVNPGFVLCEDCHRVIGVDEGLVCDDCQHLRRSPKAREEAEAAANRAPVTPATTVTHPGPGGTLVTEPPTPQKG